jgi:[NiFe] hydrogenase assembly HybE family chaperone
VNAAVDVGARPGDEVAFEQAFRQIHATRMADLPFLNPALRVEALGFRDWSGLRLGVLVTPWSINLVLLPGAATPLPATRAGDERLHAFPSGVYGFHAHDDPLTGPYQQCSLFSPVDEFGAHDDALAAARAALEALLAPAVQPAADPLPRMSRRDLFGGT